MPIGFFVNVALIFIKSGGSAVFLTLAAFACLLVGAIIQVRRRAFEKRMALALASAVRASVMLDPEGKAQCAASR
jgi:hypothetical protein